MSDGQSFTETGISDQFLPRVIDAFQLLGLERSLVISDEALRDAYREVGKRLHPDAGGEDGEFAALREAYALVSSPSRRLRHWMELRGIPCEIRGTIDSQMMDLFAKVGAVTQQAEEVIRKRDEAKSLLVRALLESETQRCREAVESAIAEVQFAMDHECSKFAEIEAADGPDEEVVARIARSLVFLEKWRTGLRSYFSRLV